MDIMIQREALLKPLQAVSGVVEKKQTHAILSNVLLTIKDGNLLLTGTDMEVELVGFIRMESLSDESVPTTVSARKLFDICRALPEGSSLRLSLEKNDLVVRAGESCFMLNTLPAQDFPDLDKSEYLAQFTIRQNQLRNLLMQTYFAMGQQDVRHYLNGTFLDIGQNTIKCVAADGHRLALNTLIDAGIGNVEARVILPRKSVLELIRLLGGDNDDDVTVHTGDKRVRFVTSDFVFTTKIINAQYPDYTRLIPKGKIMAAGDREAIKQALVRTSILSNEKMRGVRFQLEAGKLTMTANNTDQEQAEEAVVLDYTGNPLEIAFNVAYWLDVLSAISTKMIRCIFGGPSEGVIIEPVDDNDNPGTYVVMPMRL